MPSTEFSFQKGQCDSKACTNTQNSFLWWGKVQESSCVIPTADAMPTTCTQSFGGVKTSFEGCERKENVFTCGYGDARASAGPSGPPATPADPPAQAAVDPNAASAKKN